jgi:hypothetical protein
VLKSWFNYRKRDPGGKKTTRLDTTHATAWPAGWTTEFSDLLTVLRRLTELEPQQADLFARSWPAHCVRCPVSSVMACAGPRQPRTVPSDIPRHWISSEPTLNLE